MSIFAVYKATNNLHPQSFELYVYDGNLWEVYEHFIP